MLDLVRQSQLVAPATQWHVTHTLQTLLTGRWTMR